MLRLLLLLLLLLLRRRRRRLLRLALLRHKRRQGLGLGHNVAFLGLLRQLSLGLVAVALPLAVLLEGVLHADLLAEHVLPVQVRDGGVAALKVAEADEAEALAHAAVVPGHLGQAQQRAEAGEGVVEEFLVHHGVEVADEELGANVGALLLVGRRLVHAQRLAEQLDAVHDVGRVLGVRGRAELDEAEALVVLGDAVTRHMDVVDGAHLEHDFVDGCCRGALVNVAYVDCRFFVLFPGLRVS